MTAPTTNFEKQWEKGLKFKKRSGKFVGYCTFVKTQINVCQLLQICHCPANKLCKSNFWQINRFFKKKKKKPPQNFDYKTWYLEVTISLFDQTDREKITSLAFIFCDTIYVLCMLERLFLWWNNPIHEWTSKDFLGDKLLLMSHFVSLGKDTPPPLVFCKV